MRAIVLLLLLCSAASAQDGKIRLWLRGDDFGYTHASNYLSAAQVARLRVTDAL